MLRWVLQFCLWVLENRKLGFRVLQSAGFGRDDGGDLVGFGGL